MRLVSLGIGGVIVDAVGVEPLFWAGGALLAAAGVLGLRMLGSLNLRTSIELRHLVGQPAARRQYGQFGSAHEGPARSIKSAE